MNEQELIARLQEDGATETETAVLLPLFRQLAEAPAPPQPVETEALVARLLPELPTLHPTTTWRDAIGQSWLWLLLAAQARVVRREIWAASLLVMALGVVVSVVWQGGGSAAGLPLALLAPVVAAVGIATLYSPAESVWELEMTTAVAPRLLLLARLLLVFGFNLLLALLGSVALALLLPQVDLWPLITTWLAPMTFLAALAFLITVLTGASEIGMLFSLSLWALQTIRLTGDRLSAFVLYWPDLFNPTNRAWLWALALLSFACALWLGGREERGVVRNP
ncbi:MAG: hypothetical protein IPM39_26705 [Chloroflexi bacterium]|nr:hypothetical protein [Chloroflexota bacterium]